MRLLSFIFAIVCLPAQAGDLPTIQDALDDLDGTEIQDSGYIGVDTDLDWILFFTSSGLRLRVEMAVDRETLEAVEACEHERWRPGGGCKADILGTIRVKDDYFQLLVYHVSNLRSVE